MRRSPGRCLKAFSRLWHLHRCCGCHLENHGGRCRWLGGKVATYARTGSAVAFNISELPGERAEALFIAMAALVPTAGEQINHIRLWSPSLQEGTP